MRLPISVGFPDAEVLVVDADEQATVADLRAALADHRDIDGSTPLWTARGRLSDAAPLATSVRSGDRLGVGQRPDPLPGVGGRRLLMVVAGPDAGAVLPLPDTGAVTVGRRSGSTLPLADVDVSRDHLEIRCLPDHLVLTDVGSSNGTLVDGVPITAPTPVAPGSAVRVGSDEVRIGAAEVPDGRVVHTDDGRLRLDREPRHVQPVRRATVLLPAEEGDPDLPGAAWGVMAALSGVAMGVTGAVLWRNPLWLVLAGVGAAVALLGGWMQRRQAVRRWRRTAGIKQAAREREGARLAAALQRETERRLAATADPAEVLLSALGPRRTLWQRLPSDDDFATVRVGLADQPSEDVEVRDLAHGAGGDDEPPTVPAVPATVDLRAIGPLGLRGDTGTVRALARWVVGQLVVQAGPAHLQLFVLTDPADPGAGPAWDWVRWLPHCRPRRGAVARIGNTASTIRHRVDELGELIAERSAVGHGGERRGPLVVVVLDGIDATEVPGLAAVVEHGPEVGVVALACGAPPARCPAQVVAGDGGRARLLRAGRPGVDDVRLDLVRVPWAERVALAVAPLTDPLAAEVGGPPERVALRDVIADLSEPAAVVRRWTAQPRSTRAVLGRSASALCPIDIAADGPHVVVAGMTGYGKSVVMQALVLGLAVANRPDELSFMLLDFKGGNAFEPLRVLPHVAGEFTNHDPAWAVGRALDSLSAEIERRQRHLADAGVERLEQYHVLADTGALPPGLPRRLARLVIVIDEYKWMVHALPDRVVTQLVKVATQGRAYGVHLVVGSQSPDDIPQAIRDQARGAVAVRLPRSSSMVLLGTTAAERLPRGQALLRAGDAHEPTLLQVAFAGTGSGVERGRLRLLSGGWPWAGEPVADRRPADGAEQIANRAVADLAAALETARAVGGLPRCEPVWLPRLPTVLPLPGAAELPAADDPDGGVAFGVVDRVREREQPLAVWATARGNLLAVGRAGSGRSTLLRTVAASAATAAAPDGLHLYVVDGAYGLSGLAALPHTKAVAAMSDPEQVDRLLGRLEALISERGRAGSVGARPRVLLVVDTWETWQRLLGDLDDAALTKRLLAVMQSGPAVGVAVALTGSGALLVSTGVAGAMGDTAATRVVLPSTEDGYGWAGIPKDRRPLAPQPGQAIRPEDGCPLQVAVLARPGPADGAPDTSAAAQDVLLAELAARAAPDPAPPLRPLPRTAELRDLPRAGAGPWEVPIALGGDPLALRGFELDRRGPAALVVGPRGSGRSTALATAVAAGEGRSVVLWTPVGGSRLLAVAGLPAVAAVLTGTQVSRRELMLAWACAGAGPTLLVIDDAEQLAGASAATTLAEIVKVGRDSGVAVIAATTLDGLAQAPGPFLHEAAAGDLLLLAPQAVTRTTRGLVRIPAALTAQPSSGRGVLLADGHPTAVQVPLPPVAPAPERIDADRALRAAADARLDPDDASLDEMRAAVAAVRSEPAAARA